MMSEAVPRGRRTVRLPLAADSRIGSGKTPHGGSMTSQTSRNTGWRRAAVGAVASGALAAGLMAGIGLANAEPVAPADPTTGADAPPPMTADQVLAIIATEYDTGAGGGQLSNLVHQVMKLRSQGFYPSKGNQARHRGRVGQAAEPGATDRGPPEAPWPSRPGTRCAVRRSSRLRRRSGSTSTTRPTPAVGAPGGGINIPLGP